MLLNELDENELHDEAALLAELPPNVTPEAVASAAPQKVALFSECLRMATVDNFQVW